MLVRGCSDTTSALYSRLGREPHWFHIRNIAPNPFPRPVPTSTHSISPPPPNSARHLIGPHIHVGGAHCLCAQCASSQSYAAADPRTEVFARPIPFRRLRRTVVLHVGSRS